MLHVSVPALWKAQHLLRVLEVRCICGFVLDSCLQEQQIATLCWLPFQEFTFFFSLVRHTLRGILVRYKEVDYACVHGFVTGSLCAKLSTVITMRIGT